MIYVDWRCPNCDRVSRAPQPHPSVLPPRCPYCPPGLKNGWNDGVPLVYDGEKLPALR